MEKAQELPLRKKLYVDDLQRSIIVRTVLQWYFYMSAILLVVCLGAVFMDPSILAIKYVFQAFVYFAPGIVASVLLLPLLIYDMLKATNQIAGPVYRLRNVMNQLTDGNEVQPLNLRDGDRFQELADDFNRLAVAMMNDRAELNALKEAREEQPV